MRRGSVPELSARSEREGLPAAAPSLHSAHVSRFVDRLSSGPPIVADGGMGTLVAAAAGKGLRTPEEANLASPETVVSVHVGFIQAGAELIETNTFGANRAKLAAHVLDDSVERINSEGVKLAREAREVSGRDVLIAGSIGPLGESAGEHDRAAVFAEQAEALAARGVDLFMLETFFELQELALAIEAVRGVASLPIVALLTFGADGETPGGVDGATAAAALRELDVAAIGANHGAGPQAALTALAAMGPEQPLAALPNVGLAGRWGNRIVYPHADTEYFADFAAQARELGARIVGGCCGTTPVQIAAISDALKAERPASRQPIFSRAREPGERSITLEGETRFACALREGRFTATIELNPPKGGSDAGLLELCRTLEASGKVEFLDVTDNYTARARMHAMMASASIERATGIETIPHLTPRDSTVMGLESILLGAHAAGLRNILAITGDPPDVGDYPGSQGVYEVDSIGLCKIMQKLNAGESYAGKSLDAPTSFFYGVAVNPTADDVDEELRRFEQKLEAGAQFAITQSQFDLTHFDRFEQLLGGWPIPVLLGVFYVTSYPLALRLHNEVPGMKVPEAVRERFRNAGADALATGLEVARELAAEAQGRVAGIEVIAPFKAPLAALEVLPDPQPAAQAPVETGALADASTRRTTGAGTP
jgi:methionine synthase / methylenetetrahydrofolate reductase(NADPH)